MDVFARRPSNNCVTFEKCVAAEILRCLRISGYGCTVLGQGLRSGFEAKIICRRVSGPGKPSSATQAPQHTCDGASSNPVRRTVAAVEQRTYRLSSMSVRGQNFPQIEALRYDGRMLVQKRRAADVWMGRFWVQRAVELSSWLTAWFVGMLVRRGVTRCIPNPMTVRYVAGAGGMVLVANCARYAGAACRRGVAIFVGEGGPNPAARRRTQLPIRGAEER